MNENLSYTATVFVAGVVVGVILCTTLLVVPGLQTFIRHGILAMMFEESAFSAGIVAGILAVCAFQGW
jgi:amino acid permease